MNAAHEAGSKHKEPNSKLDTQTSTEVEEENTPSPPDKETTITTSDNSTLNVSKHIDKGHTCTCIERAIENGT